jgi:ArsR family transcriptional regulator
VEGGVAIPVSPNKKPFSFQAEAFRALGHPVRCQILDILHQSSEEVPSAMLLDTLRITKAGLSQHLAKLISAGLIQTRRQGRFLYVAISDPELGKASTRIGEILKKAGHPFQGTP